MKNSKLVRSFLMIALVLILSTVPLVAGCAGAGSDMIAKTLSATKVPDMNLDVYLFMDQGSPTMVPGSFFQSADIQVSTLAVWGVVNGDAYAAGGALNFASASDASTVSSKIPNVSGLWSKLSGSTVYFVYGTGGPAESLKNAISNNKFKNYDDSQVLSETANLPVSTSTRPEAICIVKPSQDAINLLKKLVPGYASTIDSAYTWGKPQVILAGFYSSQPLNVATIFKQLQDGTIMNADLGIAVSVTSGMPGFIVSVAGNKYLDDAKLTKLTVNNYTEYKNSFSVGRAGAIPAFINISGNHIFVSASGKEAYAQTLMSGFKR